MWFPGSSRAALGSILTSPRKLFDFAVPFAGGCTPGCRRLAFSSCVSRSLLMEPSLQTSHFISQKVPGSSTRRFVLVEFRGCAGYVGAG